MRQERALRLALDTFFRPKSAKSQRAAPLPDGLFTLLEVAAGDADAIADAEKVLGRPGANIREAAEFYIEQVMFHPAADHFRLLGGTRDSSPADLRRNMAMLLRWLHPDSRSRPNHAVYVARVTSAWNEIKTPEKRAAYDARLQRSDVRREREDGRIVKWSVDEGRRPVPSTSIVVADPVAPMSEPGLLRRIARRVLLPWRS